MSESKPPAVLSAEPDERLAWYDRRIEETIRILRADSDRWQKISWIRGILFLVAATLLVCGVVDAWGSQKVLLAGAAGTFVLFVAVASLHEALEKRIEEQKVWLLLDRRARARKQRDWSQLPPCRIAAPESIAALSRDLDVFGERSLFQILGDVRIPAATTWMSEALAHVPDPAEIEARQEAIRELANDDPFREGLIRVCQRLATDGEGPVRLLDWAERPRDFDRRGILIWFARGIAAAVTMLAVGVLAGIIPLPVGGPALLGALGINLLLTVAFAGRIHGQFNDVSPRSDEMGHYENAFQHVVHARPRAARLVELTSALAAEEAPVTEGIRKLHRIAWRANLRRHGILFVAWLALQFLVLWDFHVVEQLQAWKQRHGRKVRGWLDCLGQWESLAALGQFARDQTGWTYPEVTTNGNDNRQIVADGLFHPLLPPGQAVANDVAVGPPGTFLLVTGSNMSGKSTLLRAIGTNVLLAQLGVPVAARSMSWSPLQIETSMRIQDSLADGVSFFMAELRRLKEIIDIARQAEDQKGHGVLFLLDEILQGTNSRERHIAVTRVIARLIRYGAIGAVSTHDLELATAPELAHSCRNIHFRESFETIDGTRRMFFDYRAREGIATTTNALELLRLVGLE